MTYRYRGHSVSDPGAYRTKEEVAQYQERDPIATLGKHLVDKKIAKAEELTAWDKEAKDRMTEIEAFADQAPPAPIEEITQHVYADDDHT
jgi:pyruvate dehydrogenase E1 component alpha subunit